MLNRRAALGLAATVAALACGTVPAWSQNFTKQVHIIVPYGPGGTSDILARLIGPKLSAAIGQPVIVENKPSESGNIGADYVAKQPGDAMRRAVRNASRVSSGRPYTNVPSRSGDGCFAP